MYIKRNHTSIAGREYHSVLLVQGKRVPGRRRPGRPSAQAPPPKSVVVHETLANLSRLPEELIRYIESYCKGQPNPVATPTTQELPSGASCPAVHQGPCYGVLGALHALAGELGIVQAVGQARRVERLALYLIYARVFHQGSRLSAARCSEEHAVREVLNVGRFDEDDLYPALDYLEANQQRIEDHLYARGQVNPNGTVFLYDVTSHYFEGLHNELAEYGYPRDIKRGKKQVVAGLLTDGQGEPVSIQLYPGNTGDAPTFLDAVEKVKVRFGAQEVVLVGDRGMIKRMGKRAVGEAHFHYVTALTDPQIRALLKKGVIQMGLFEAQPAEVEASGKRYVLRCNPQTQARERARREDQWRRVRAKIQARNEAVGKSAKKQEQTSLRQAQELIGQYRLSSWVSVHLEGRQVVWAEDAAARQHQEQLDGCYVVESDVPKAAASTQQVHDRYLGLTQVERDFRTIKTGLLELRPIFLRKAGRTRGHALVTMLALKLAREIDRRVAPLGLTVEDAMTRLKGVHLVCLGDPQAALWRLADTYPTAQTEVLGVFPKLPAPLLYLKKANVNRLRNRRRGRD